MTVPYLIAHRGYATYFPENTLLSLEQALRSGASLVEFDVQFCLDGTPVVFHDQSLERTTGVKKDLLDLPYKEIRTIQACETARFGKQFVNMNIGIPALTEMVNLLKNWPTVTIFVDVKGESLKKFGIEQPMKTVLQIIKPILGQCCLISKNASAVRFSRSIGAKNTGWILSEWSELSHGQATELSPDYLFCNHKKFPSPATRLWPGPWQWCIYEIIDPEHALRLYAQGAAFIETKNIGEMLKHPLLRQGGRFADAVL